ncbi:AAA family ATPase [Ascidiaceihabitans sp.]|uniref:AAA family ATPase n=1 Tax=Ascidiaceihabitans sp. TaxID=1872644 RepID=UPI00329776FD
MNRIMIIGQAGSGKSTLARDIGRRGNLPVVHIDLIHWKTGWIERTQAEKTPLVLDAIAQDRWVFEGGNSSTYPQRMARADTLIWLDLPAPLRLRRALWRSVKHYGSNRPDLPKGCPERLDPAFYRWIWRTRHSGRASLKNWFETAPPHLQKYHLQSKHDVMRWVQNTFPDT